MYQSDVDRRKSFLCIKVMLIDVKATLTLNQFPEESEEHLHRINKINPLISIDKYALVFF